MKNKLNIVSFLLFILGVSLLSYGIYKTDKTKTIKEPEKKVVKITNYKTINNSPFKDYYTKAGKVVDNMPIEEKVGQLFLVRYEKEAIEKYNKYYPGGYILFAKDFENHTIETMKVELDEVQRKSKYPLIMGVDEEGGFVTRVSSFKPFREEKFKSPKEYYNEGGYKLLEKTEKEKAQLLKSIGLNLNLAPVVDISTNKEDFINNRSFGSLEEVKVFSKNMVRYANENKINSCLKHFPGYGNNKDTHTGAAIDNRSYEELKSVDFIPFEEGIKEGVPSILISHNIINSIDKNYPASLSSKVIKELRETLDFGGIIITDDLDMDAVKKYVDDKKASTLAINAGNDMIITGDFINMYEEAIQAVKNGIIKEETLNKAVTRIIAWKYYSKIMK